MTAIAAIYCRVSKKRNESISIESQESLLREYCKKNDFEVYRVYIDNGKSGKSTISRDDYLVLIDEAKQRKFNKVIIWRITRFGRNLKDLLYACDLFEQYDIALISYSENYDFSTAVGKLIRNIIGAVAEFELDEYSENIRMVLAEKAKNGGRMCHFVLGYDVLDKNSFIVNKEEKTVLQKQVDRGHVVGIGRDVFAGQPFEPLLLFFESLFQGVEGAVGELSGEIVLQVKSGNLLYVAVEGLTLLLVDLQPVVERSARQVGDRVECHLDGAGFEGEQQRGIL